MQNEQVFAALAQHFDHTSDVFRDRRQRFHDWLHATGQTLIHSDKHGGFWYAAKYRTVLHAQRNPSIFFQFPLLHSIAPRTAIDPGNA